MDGYELARRCASAEARRELGWSRSPATARTPIARARDAAGFDEHLVKPIDLEEINQLLDRVGHGAAAPASAPTR